VKGISASSASETHCSNCFVEHHFGYRLGVQGSSGIALIIGADDAVEAVARKALNPSTPEYPYPALCLGVLVGGWGWVSSTSTNVTSA
jgi:hypothetical protein